jgi:hypothetical protein
METDNFATDIVVMGVFLFVMVMIGSLIMIFVIKSMQLSTLLFLVKKKPEWEKTYKFSYQIEKEYGLLHDPYNKKEYIFYMDCEKKLISDEYYFRTKSVSNSKLEHPWVLSSLR